MCGCGRSLEAVAVRDEVGSDLRRNGDSDGRRELVVAVLPFASTTLPESERAAAERAAPLVRDVRVAAQKPVALAGREDALDFVVEPSVGLRGVQQLDGRDSQKKPHGDTGRRTARFGEVRRVEQANLVVAVEHDNLLVGTQNAL